MSITLCAEHISGNGTWWTWYQNTYQRGRMLGGIFVEEDLLMDEGL